jgi:hypothetical protein
MTAAAAERFPRISPAAPRYAVGLMAGTSLDGIDAALVCIEGAGNAIRIQTLATHYQPYTPDERAGLLRLIELGSLADLCAWDAYLGERFAQAAQAVIQKASPPRVDCIGSHGQTVWHAPDAQVLGTPTPNTLQIGQPDVIAARVGAPVVADFRTRDMAYGGQGAPLVPLVDWLLLRSDTEPRAALNLGGMANLTVLPAGGAPDAIRAFDTGPANALIDLAVQHGTGGDADLRPRRRACRVGRSPSAAAGVAAGAPVLRAAAAQVHRARSLRARAAGRHPCAVPRPAATDAGRHAHRVDRRYNCRRAAAMGDAHLPCAARYRFGRGAAQSRPDAPTGGAPA